jgi:small GTP-binding protein
MAQAPRFKVVMLGNSGVGKTALVERISEDIFQECHVPTVGAQFTSLQLAVGDQTILIELWDTAGQEVFRSLVGFYARDSMGMILMFDLTQSATFEELPQWVQFARSNSPQAVIILFGNKMDLEDQRKVSKSDGEAFAEKNQLIYFEGSAKTGETVRDAFERLAEILSQTTEISATSTQELSENKEKKKGCC